MTVTGANVQEFKVLKKAKFEAAVAKSIGVPTSDVTVLSGEAAAPLVGPPRPNAA
jgi:hypothetical protein